jgi:hypothetical protein
MIVTELYDGQGLGNQLWCYFVTRAIAENLGLQYGIMRSDKFKGRDFMTLDMGNVVVGGSGPEGGPPDSLPLQIEYYYKELVHDHPVNKVNISSMDPNLLSIKDNTKIDGCMQSLEYLDLEKIKSWFTINDGKNIIDYSGDDICVVHIRGGDFLGSTAILDRNYFRRSKEIILERNPDVKFVIVTDDVNYARDIFPNHPIVGGSATNQSDNNKASHHIGGPIWMDWSILYNAKNIILSSSSFSFWPAITNMNNPFVIAPMYWGDFARSDGYWSCWEMIVDKWMYLDRSGVLKSSELCILERDLYKNNNVNIK